MSSPAARDVTWMARQLTNSVAGVAHVLVLSADGQPMAASDQLPPERAIDMASVTAGLIGLCVGAADLMGGGGVRQAIVEMHEGYLIVMRVSDGSCLAVLASIDANVEDVAYQMGRMVTRLGAHLTPALRTELTQAHG